MLDITISDVTIQWIATIFGIIFGLGGLVLGIINYWRENPKVSVVLQWDMSSFGPTGLDPEMLYALVTVSNIGRRPVYISHAHLIIPGFKELILVNDSISGSELAEGSRPAMYTVKQDNELEKYAKNWKKIKAAVQDSAGKTYYSKPVKIKPQWAI